MPEKQHREDRTKSNPQHELVGQGRLRPVLQRKGPQQSKNHGDAVVDVHRPEEIALFALKAQATDRTPLVHRKPGAEERPCPTALTAQAHPTPDEGQRAWESTLLLHRCIPPLLTLEQIVLLAFVHDHSSRGATKDRTRSHSIYYPRAAKMVGVCSPMPAGTLAS